jgi:CheY-like chemotaxis protein
MRELQRILHVDDDDDIRAIAAMALELIGLFELLQCASGKQATEEAASFRPDLLLLDYMMPDMDGKETLCELRKIPGLNDVPVVFMTARVNENLSNDLRRDGALGVIAKPFDPMDLAAQLRELWQIYNDVESERVMLRS